MLHLFCCKPNINNYTKKSLTPSCKRKGKLAKRYICVYIRIEMTPTWDWYQCYTETFIKLHYCVVSDGDVNGGIPPLVLHYHHCFRDNVVHTWCSRYVLYSVCYCHLSIIPSFSNQRNFCNTNILLNCKNTDMYISILPLGTTCITFLISK